MERDPSVDAPRYGHAGYLMRRDRRQSSPTKRFNIRSASGAAHGLDHLRRHTGTVHQREQITPDAALIRQCHRQYRIGGDCSVHRATPVMQDSKRRRGRESIDCDHHRVRRVRDLNRCERHEQ
ncbi:hypothetical protein MAGR_15340 [Mycolicibacterium agri]|uniref:Uncharacterized protein n=1 Tax=Mycolicibacterium agri TaxID=36811 RepID=A0A7I9VXG6_MYCAG|nr:hypothetical protein MAGR_15340 [Mycolicibacterium agri]